LALSPILLDTGSDPAVPKVECSQEIISALMDARLAPPHW